MTSNEKECAICYDNKEENVTCKCKISLCVDCFTEYTDSCYTGKGKLPKCVVCPREYLIDCFETYETASAYAEILYEFIKKNPDFQTKINTVTKEKIIIERLRRKKAEIFDKLPEALKYVIKLTMMDKYKKAMNINMKFVEAQAIKRKCFSGVCPTGNLDQDNAGNWICDTCDNTFCRRCEHIMFDGHICKKEDLESLEFITALVHCPSCNAPVQKDGGCSSLTCSICGTLFEENTGKEGGHGGMEKKLELKSKTYSLLSELEDKYDQKILNMIRNYELKKPETLSYDVFVKYLEVDELDEDQILELFDTYSNFREAQYNSKLYFKTLLEIRQLHIDDQLTLENIKKIIG